MYGDVLLYFIQRYEEAPSSLSDLLNGVDNITDTMHEIWGEMVGVDDVLREYEMVL
jgi:hypothetical protein